MRTPCGGASTTSTSSCVTSGARRFPCNSTPSSRIFSADSWPCTARGTGCWPGTFARWIRASRIFSTITCRTRWRCRVCRTRPLSSIATALRASCRCRRTATSFPRTSSTPTGSARVCCTIRKATGARRREFSMSPRAGCLCPTTRKRCPGRFSAVCSKRR